MKYVLLLNIQRSFLKYGKSGGNIDLAHETFNGYFLPLALALPDEVEAEDRRKAYGKLYRKLGKDTQQDIFQHLQAILRGWESHGKSFQQRIDWNDFDFATFPSAYSAKSTKLSAANGTKSMQPKRAFIIRRRILHDALWMKFSAASKIQQTPKYWTVPAGRGYFPVLAFRSPCGSLE